MDFGIYGGAVSLNGAFALESGPRVGARGGGGEWTNSPQVDGGGRSDGLGKYRNASVIHDYFFDQTTRRWKNWREERKPIVGFKRFSARAL